jgi:hypothetical protein
LVASVLLPTPPFGFATTITVMKCPGFFVERAGAWPRGRARFRFTRTGA